MFLVVAVVRLNLKALSMLLKTGGRCHESTSLFTCILQHTRGILAISACNNRTTLKLIVIDNLQRKFEQRASQIHHRKLNFSWIYMYMLPGKLARKNNLNSIDDYRWTRRATNSSRLFTLYSFFRVFHSSISELYANSKENILKSLIKKTRRKQHDDDENRNARNWLLGKLQSWDAAGWLQVALTKTHDQSWWTKYYTHAEKKVASRVTNPKNQPFNPNYRRLFPSPPLCATLFRVFCKWFSRISLFYLPGICGAFGL